MIYDIVAGTTLPLQFQLLENGAAIDLTGCTVTILTEDRTGTTVVLGTVSIVDATSGKVKFTPTNASVFVATVAPYFARWKVVDGSGNISYVPTSTRDLWNIVGT